MQRWLLERYVAVGLFGAALLLSACGSLSSTNVAAPSASVAPVVAEVALPAAVEPQAGRAPSIAEGAIGTTIDLEDTDWTGGFRRGYDGLYGDRTVLSVFGAGSGYSTIEASFRVAGEPVGTAELSIEGMDSVGREKTPLRITVNGAEIFAGPNPLPDDDAPAESGTWELYSWPFDARLLRPGQNIVSVSNLGQGALSRPPFLMLDYAMISFEER